MSLDRIDRDPRKPSLINQIQKISAEQKYQQDELLPLPTNPDEFIARLDDLWYQTLMMKQEELQDAEAKYQQTLLIATVHEQHKVLVDFINDMRSEIKVLQDKQIQLLSEQEEYRKSVRDTVCNSMNDIYTVVEERQNTFSFKLLTVRSHSSFILFIASSSPANPERSTSCKKGKSPVSKVTVTLRNTGIQAQNGSVKLTKPLRNALLNDSERFNTSGKAFLLTTYLDENSSLLNCKYCHTAH